MTAEVCGWQETPVRVSGDGLGTPIALCHFDSTQEHLVVSTMRALTVSGRQSTGEQGIDHRA